MSSLLLAASSPRFQAFRISGCREYLTDRGTGQQRGWDTCLKWGTGAGGAAASWLWLWPDPGGYLPPSLSIKAPKEL